MRRNLVLDPPEDGGVMFRLNMHTYVLVCMAAFFRTLIVIYVCVLHRQVTDHALFWNESVGLPIKIKGLASNSKEVNPLKHAVSYYMYYLL
jgi:hypothetical protein